MPGDPVDRLGRLEPPDPTGRVARAGQLGGEQGRRHQPGSHQVPLGPGSQRDQGGGFAHAVTDRRGSASRREPGGVGDQAPHRDLPEDRRAMVVEPGGQVGVPPVSGGNWSRRRRSRRPACGGLRPEGRQVRAPSPRRRCPGPGRRRPRPTTCRDRCAGGKTRTSASPIVDSDEPAALGKRPSDRRQGTAERREASRRSRPCPARHVVWTRAGSTSGGPAPSIEESPLDSTQDDQLLDALEQPAQVVGLDREQGQRALAQRLGPIRRASGWDPSAGPRRPRAPRGDRSRPARPR